MKTSQKMTIVSALAALCLGAFGAGIHVREAVEWENSWMDGTGDANLPRVLLIGDSVCNAYQGEVRKRLAGVARVDYWASSKCLTDRSYLTALKYRLDEARYRVVHFNNGLHSIEDTTNPAEWANRLRDALRLIRARGRGARTIWATSTPVRDAGRLRDNVVRLNELGRVVAAEEGATLNDLFALMDPLPREEYWSDMYHYQPKGVAKEADQVAAKIRAALALCVPMPERGVCAHRGDCADYPENTVPALLAAVRKGAQMVEFDVRRCKTGELVILHDETVDRTTDGKGLLANLTFAQVRALDAGRWKDARFAGTRIPTFDEALGCLPREGVWINIDCGNADVAFDVARILRAQRRQHQAFVSVSLEGIRLVRREMPEVLVCNMSRTGPWGKPWTSEQSRAYAQDTVASNCDFIQLITPCAADDILSVHAAGGKVSYFFSDDPARGRELFAQGVDFILTNNLDGMLSAFGTAR